MNNPVLSHNEKIKDIRGYEGLYAATTYGRIWSYPKKAGRSARIGKWLRECVCSNGYVIVVLCKNGKTKSKRAHKVIAQTFIRNPDNKLQINHKNGIKTDNSVENLEWSTASENGEHAYRTGLSKITIRQRENMRKLGHIQGKKNRKLSRREAIEIRVSWENKGKMQKELAKEYKGSKSVICEIISGKTYAY